MYAELHARSAFSFLEGASLPEDLAYEAQRLEISGLALVDTDNVSGAPRFYMAAKNIGIRPHIGAEITAAAGGRYTLLVENRTGYQNLCRLISSMKLRSEKGKAAASEAEFRQYARGLICLADGSQPMGTLIDIYGVGNVYAEVQRHLIREEEIHNERVRELARQWKIPLIATNGVRYANPRKRELMDALTCVRHKTNIAEAGRLLEQNAERYLKTPRAMKRLFSTTPEWIDRAVELSDRLRFTLADLGYEFPRYPVPPGETMDSVLRARTLAGALTRYGARHEKAYRQIERELKLIEKLKLPGYFLIVWDIVEFCRREGILVQGRGSAANSAVCYSLGITAIDPVKMELLFERFLSEERGEWPDIDLDLPSGDDRERAIQYVYQRYGKLGAAMTANVITYRSRSAVRDVGKALGFDEESLSRVSKLSARGAWEQNRAREQADAAQEKQFHLAGLDLENARVAKLLALSREILNLPRHLGQHSGGMVICQGQLDSIVPLEPATMPGRVVVQWDKEDCADLGLIKVDLLGLGMMAALKDSITLIRDHYHEEVDLAHLPVGDPAVYRALQKADTVGLFQVESRAQMSCLPRMKPTKFYDIVVQVAIIRPGPIVGKMMHPYLRRREGYEEPMCLHPLLEPVLKRTLGVPLFQEQLLRMAMIIADFTGGEAEELRRAMGFKRSEERMCDIETRLRAGMEKKGVIGEKQDTIVQAITSFAKYGFPESHAASFALIAYASAYLKCHYLAAFTAALLNNQPMGFYSPLTLVKDAQRHGLHFLPVDVARSVWPCTLELGDVSAAPLRPRFCVRLGFNYVKGFHQKTAEAVVAERAKGEFAGIDDLRRRVPELSKSDLTTLADLGALNEIGKRKRHRRDALWQSELALRPVGELLEAACPPETPSPLTPMNPVERLQADFANSGLSIGAHPMRFHREQLNRMRVVPAGEVKRVPDGRSIRVAGAVICRQQPGTAKGFVFLTLEDETGIANIILKPDVFQRLRVTILNNSYLLVDGMMQNQGGVASVKATHARPCPVASMAVAASHDFH